MRRSMTASRLCAVALVVFLLPFGSLLQARDAADVARVGQDIRYLASDELEGRGPGSAGLEKAAVYVREAFERAGLRGASADGSYRQPFDVKTGIRVVAEKTALVLHGPDGQVIECQMEKDFQPLAAGAVGKAEAEVIFIGYGISAAKEKYDDYQGIDVKGKIVLMLRREPQQDDPASPLGGKKTTKHAQIRTKLQQAKRNGAAAILLVNDPFTTVKESQDTLSKPAAFGTRSGAVPMAHVSQCIVNRLLAASPLAIEGSETGLGDLAAVEQEIDRTFRPCSQRLAGWTAEIRCDFETVQARVANIVGVLDGVGPLANETIVIGAHYDHIGYGEFGSRRRGVHEVHNGADDNASGTAAIMELARRFGNRSPKPARRLVFIAFSAEEKGLIGSRYYIEHPLFPLEDTVAMFNFDMIGQMRGDALHVYGARSADEFPALIDQAIDDAGLALKPVARIMANGDHFGFYQRGIPAFHFFTGLTEQYHTPDDDFETLNIKGVVRAIDYCERLLERVVELPARPSFRKATPPKRGPGGVAYLGITPDYAGEADGVTVSAVAVDSPAHKAGVQPGDRIVQFGDASVVSMQNLLDGLKSNKAGDMVTVVVQRGEEKISCSVKLGSPPGS